MADATSQRWWLKEEKGKLYVVLNGGQMRKPTGEEYKHVTGIQRGNSAGEVQFHFSNSKLGKNFRRVDFYHKGNAFSHQFEQESKKNNAVFISKLTEVTGVKVQKKRLLEPRENSKEPAKTTKRQLLSRAEESVNMPGHSGDALTPPTFLEKLIGTYDVRVSLLKAAPEEYSVRKLRQEWVVELKKRILKDNTKLAITLPTLIDPTQVKNKQSFRVEDLSSYRLFVLGGNHVVTALQAILQDHPDVHNLGQVRVDIFAGLTTEEAHTVGNRHNARCETLQVTWQDKVRQARQLYLKGVQNLAAETAKLLSDITLKEVPKESISTVVAIAKYSQAAYDIVESLFDKFENTMGVGRSIPQRLFKTLQGDVFSDEDKKLYLRKALDGKIGETATDAERQKKMKIVQNTFKSMTGCETWGEACTLYPKHTDDDVLLQFTDFKLNQKIVPKPLNNHIASAILDQDVPLLEADIAVEITVKHKGETVDISSLEFEKEKSKIIKVVCKKVALEKSQEE